MSPSPIEPGWIMHPKHGTSLIALLLLALLPLTAAAEAPLGFYLGGGFGWSQLSAESDDYYHDCCYYYGPYEFDQGEEDNAFSAHAGYRFNPWIGVELAFLDSGKPEWDERYIYVEDLDDVFDAFVEMDLQSFQLSALGILPFAQVWEGYFRLGAAWWTADAEQTLYGGEFGDVYTRTVDDDGIDVLVGIGLGASPAPNWQIRVEYQSYWIEEDLLLNNEESSVDSFVVELQYRFGAPF
jgi:hypothetical protein